MPDRWPSRATLTRKVTQRIDERFERLRVASKRLRDEEDGEAVHDVRVAARRLSQMLWLWKPILRGDEVDRLRRKLRRRRRELADLREIEVHHELLKRIRPSADADARAQLRGKLEGRHRRERRAAAKRRRWTFEPASAATLVAPTGDVEWEAARAQIEARRERLRSRVERRFESAWTDPDDARYHNARIALRRWRYALDAMAEAGVMVAGKDDAVTLPRMQDTLGGVQDLSTLAGRLKKRRLGASHPLEMEIDARLERRRAAARRVVLRWLERRGPGGLDGAAAAPGSTAQRRTTRKAVPPGVTARPRAARSEGESPDA